MFISLISGLAFFALSLMIAVLIHESSHALVANHYNIKTKRLQLLPFGAQIEMDIGFLPKNQKVIILLAGSFGNIIFALSLGALMWLFPVIFSIWEILIITNASVAMLNMLPIYPLDGGKILHALFGERARKISKIISTSIFLLLLFASIFLIFNTSLIILSVSMLLMINLEFGQSEFVSKFKSRQNNTSLHDVAITTKTTLFEAYKLVSPRHFTRFIITDKNNIMIYENELEAFLLNNSYETPITYILFKHSR